MSSLYAGNLLQVQFSSSWSPVTSQLLYAVCLPKTDTTCWHVVQSQAQDWSDQETLLLLEALELHKDQWGDIADHVGTKSQVQCILHFLQLPIEDEFLDELEDRGRKLQGVHGPSQQPGDSQEGTPATDLIPFADTGNPILSQVVLPFSGACEACKLCLVLYYNSSSYLGVCN